MKDGLNVKFEQMPRAKGLLINKVANIEKLLFGMSEPKEKPDKWMDIHELCKYLHDKPARQTIYGYVSTVVIPFHKGIKKMKFNRGEINTSLNEDKSNSAKKIEVVNELFLISYKNNKREGNYHG